MSSSFTLSDALALRDLQVLLSRAARIEDGSVRLIADGGVLAVYVAVLYPQGLLDETPTVLGLRTFAVGDDDAFDTVVPLRSFAQRIENRVADVDDDAAPVTVALPLEVNTVTWAGISPPRGGWVALPGIPRPTLEAAAEAGIAEVAAAIPTGTGAQLVQKVRAEVWGRPIETVEHVPAGAAFAAVSLGFLGGAGSAASGGASGGTGGAAGGAETDATAEVALFESGPWSRLTTPRGHVLVKRRAWSLAR